MTLRRAVNTVLIALGVLFGPSIVHGLMSIAPVKASAAAQVGCSSGCDFETSFTTTNKNYDGSNTGTGAGWTADIVNTSTSFNSRQSGVSQSGGWADDLGRHSEVITAANYASGAGGRGFRQYRSVGTTGKNGNGGGIKFTIPTQISAGTLNVSWMERWLAGTNWNYPGHGPEPHYIKEMYMLTAGRYVICGYEGTGGYGCEYNGTSATSTTCSWVFVNGGQNADGLWHNYEYQLDITNQTARFWIDGSLCVNQSWSFPLWTGLKEVFVSNQEFLNVDSYADFDDIKIEGGLTAGDRIGSPTEIGGGGSGGGTGTNTPAAATGLRIRMRVPGVGGGLLFSRPR